MVKLVQASSVTYDIGPKGCSDVASAEYAKTMWPQQEAELVTPVWFKDTDGTNQLTEYQSPPKATPLMKSGDAAFAAGNYAEATAFYRKVLELSPNNYFALLFLGDCAYRSGFAEDALEMYRKAEAANPAAPQSYFFQASVLTDQGQREQALDAYAEALIRSSRRATLLKAIAVRAKKLGIVPPTDLFHPQAVAQQVDGKFRVCLASTTAHWIAYGLCKAMWLGEPGHREALTGSTDHHFSNIEEQECLGALLSYYGSQRRAGKTPPEPELDRLLTIAEAGMMDGFILLELATRAAPQAPLYVSEGSRRALKAYVRRFVFEAPGALPDAGAP